MSSKVPQIQLKMKLIEIGFDKTTMVCLRIKKIFINIVKLPNLKFLDICDP
jgi:hypothetical protein